MADGSANQRDAGQALSALVDGELDALEVQRLCAAWRDDASLRREWHDYHLIGDVLRSDDLASDAVHDEAFLASLRARLTQEPVVLAPRAEAHRAPARKRAWAAPFAVAAGFVAVAGVLAITRVGVPVDNMAPTVATLQSPAQAQAADAQGAQPGDTELAAADLRLVRDGRLDRYLAAHKQFGNPSGLSVPGVMLRNAAAVVPER